VLQENRAFLRRAVRHLAHQGIEQFIDLGSGIPTVGNVHEVAQAVRPGARVVYVDHDPVAVAHSKAILAGNPTAIIVGADLRKPTDVLAHPELRELIDLGEPVGVLLNAVLHFVPHHDEAAGIVSQLAERLAPGSYLAISHATTDASSDGRRAGARATETLYNRTVAAMAMRSQPEVVELFGKLSIVEPGVVRIPLWRPDSPDDVGADTEEYPGYAGVGRID
jgi:trans-aconitate methyltransferase